MTRRSRCRPPRPRCWRLRQQQVIAEETGVDATVDPLGGSWFVEALTDETERQVWRYIEEIDRRGGMVAAIGEGYPQREIADAAYRFQREFDAGERRVVGVNAYVDASEETTVPVLAVPEGSLERQLARLERTRRERDASAVEAALRGLREAAARPGSSETNLMPHFIRCAEAYATLGRAVRRAARGLRGVPRARRGLIRSSTRSTATGWSPVAVVPQALDATGLRRWRAGRSSDGEPPSDPTGGSDR